MYCFSGFFFFIFLDCVCKLHYHNAVLILWVDEDGSSAAYVTSVIVLDGSIMIIFI